MKKFLISIGLTLGISLSATAQNTFVQSLLNAQSLYISNAPTFVTNLSWNAISISTNLSGSIWTNNFGQTETATNITPAYTNSPSIATNIGATYNLLKDASLCWSRDNIYMTTAGATNSCLYVHTLPAASGSAAATNGLSIVIEALPDGVRDANNVTATFTTTGINAVTGTGGLGWYFPVNSQIFAGCQKFRLLKVYAVAPTAAASDFWIDKIEYIGQQP